MSEPYKTRFYTFKFGQQMESFMGAQQQAVVPSTETSGLDGNSPLDFTFDFGQSANDAGSGTPGETGSEAQFNADVFG